MSVAVLLTVFAVVGRVISHSGDSGSGSGSSSGSGIPPYYLCNPEDYNMQTPSMPFPTLPSQFSTLIEATFNEYNVTSLAVEHYDYPGNRARLDIYYRKDSQKEKDISIIDYNKDEVILIPDRNRGKACSVQTISGNEDYDSPFGVTTVNGSIHVMSAGAIYEVAGNSSVMYMGVDTVRGIQCNHWQACHVDDDNSSYLVDYYFAASNWEFALSGETEGETVPIQIEVNYLYDGLVETYVYSFIAFHSGPDAVSDSTFAVPTGLPCVGRPAGKDLPSPPQYFSMLIESQENPMSIVTAKVSSPSHR